MADEKHVHGSMSTEEQEKTFEAFTSWVGYSMAVCVVTLIVLYLIAG